MPHIPVESRASSSRLCSSAEDSGHNVVRKFASSSRSETVARRIFELVMRFHPRPPASRRRKDVRRGTVCYGRPRTALRGAPKPRIHNLAGHRRCCQLFPARPPSRPRVQQRGAPGTLANCGHLREAPVITGCLMRFVSMGIDVTRNDHSTDLPFSLPPRLSFRTPIAVRPFPAN